MNGARRIKRVEYSRKFLKAAKRLSARVLEQVQKREKLFRNNPHSSQLKTHKLSGREKDLWAFWINRSYRIKFLFITNEEVLFLDIGTHKIYK